MQAVHFYHVFACEWEEPIAEHLAAFEGLPMHVGVVGRPEDRQSALAALGGVEVAVEADEGWEQVTLAALHAYAQEHDHAILYAHTKGASNPSDFSRRWRTSMTEHLIAQWPKALEAIEKGCDLAGAHWIEGHAWPHFSGNYWMASAAYLRTLPPCGNGDRMEAEFWVGQNEPKVFDMFPGNPMAMFM